VGQWYWYSKRRGRSPVVGLIEGIGIRLVLSLCVRCWVALVRPLLFSDCCVRTVQPLHASGYLHTFHIFSNLYILQLLYFSSPYISLAANFLRQLAKYSKMLCLSSPSPELPRLSSTPTPHLRTIAEAADWNHFLLQLTPKRHFP
jgi:hypothetical protein